MLTRILFLDDRTKRIEGARKKYANCDLTIVTNVKECLRMMAWNDYEIISLDHDLEGNEFSFSTRESGMEIIKYIQEYGWPPERKKPEFIIHSSNLFAANKMYEWLSLLEFSVIKIPFGWKKYQRGVVAGAFDVFHVGYALLLEEIKESCFHLTALLHEKPGTVFDIADRERILFATKYIDAVEVYRTEEELTELLESGRFEVRFLGGDHSKNTSRPNLSIETVYITREHAWSATRFKEMIREAA